MRITSLLKTSAAVALAVGCLVTAVAVAAPFLVDGALLRDKLMTRVAELTGGDVKISGRVRLQSFGALFVEAEGVSVTAPRRLGAIRNFEARRMEARISWLDLIAGADAFDKLTLEGVVFDAQADVPFSDGAQNVVAALEASPFEEMIVREGRARAGGGLDGLEIMHLRVSRSRSGRRLSMRGRIVWNGEQMTLRGRRGRPAQIEGGITAPLEVSLASAAFALDFIGQLKLGDEPSLSGDIDIVANEAARLAGVMGQSWSLPHGIRSFAAEGSLRWRKGEAILDSASLSLNGHAATGLLTVNYETVCPAITGALAFGALRLDGLALDEHAAALAGNRCLRADLRISADSVSAGSLAAGPVAASLSLAEGKLIASIAELEIFSGNARGQVEIDMTKDEFAFDIRATGEDIDIGRAAEATNSKVWLLGKAGFNASFKTRGASLDAILANMSGKAKIMLAEGGAFGPSIAGIFTAAATAEDNEVGAMEAISAGFSLLRADLTLKEGVVAFESLEIKGGGASIVGKGEISIPRRHVQCRLQLKTAVRADLSAAAAKATETLVVEGEWGKLKISVNGRAMDAGESAPF